MTILNAIRSIFGIDTNKNTDPTGVDAIRTAVQEYQDLADQEFTATLGEPDVIEQGGKFFNDPKVVVPIENGPFGEEQRLVFDLPRGEDEEMAEFNQLLTLFGLTFETMEDLTGMEAPVGFAAGNLVVDWDAMESPETDDYWEEELAGDESDTEKGAEKEGESDSGVSVEETTISAEGDDD